MSGVVVTVVEEAIERVAELEAISIAFTVASTCDPCGIDRFAYPGLPAETQLLWYKDLETT